MYLSIKKVGFLFELINACWDESHSYILGTDYDLLIIVPVTALLW